MAAQSPPKLAQKQSLQSAITKDGRYIPYSGGLMTWFENSGVLNNEAGNNYQFHTQIDVETVRVKLYERWGEGETVDRRAIPRAKTKKPISMIITTPEGEELQAQTEDLSTHGLQVQIVTTEVNVKKGDSLKLKLFEDPKRTKLIGELPAEVMWARQTGRRRIVWNLGLAFRKTGPEVTDKLMKLLNG